MMAGPKTRVIIDILEEHYEELAFLWAQRQNALRSPEYTSRELADLEERIEARVQGLLIGGEAIVPLVEEGLAEDDPAVAFAAAYALLRLDSQLAREKVSNAFVAAQGGALEGIRQALCHGLIDELKEWLDGQLADAAPPIAVAAAEALAFHEMLDSEDARLDKLLADTDGLVRAAAWRVAALLDSRDAS